MAKSIAVLFGIVYVAMGILGFLNTGLIGPNGYFASNSMYNIVFIVIGAVLLLGAYFMTAATRTINSIVGIVLVVVAISGFLMVPDRGTMMGMLVSGTDHWMNLILGAVLALSGFFAGERTARFTPRYV